MNFMSKSNFYSNLSASFPHGSVRVDESNMTHFVADNLELKIKSASSNESKKFGKRTKIVHTCIKRIFVFLFAAPSRQGSARSSTQPMVSTTEQIQRQFFTAFPQIDANALNDIEIEAQYLAANLDGITENLCNLLHSVSAGERFKNRINDK